MKNLKRLASLLLALVMVFSLATTAFAAEDGYDITITNANELEEHSYVAYQIFTGTIQEVDGQQTLVDLAWGDGVNAKDLMTALVGDDTIGAKFDTDQLATINAAIATDASENAMKYAADAVAKVLNGLTAAELEIASDLIADNLTGTPAALQGAVNYYTDMDGNKLDAKPQEGEEGVNYKVAYKSPYTVNVDEAGYYMIKDADGYTPGEGESYTNYILRVVKDVEVNAKSDTVEVDKSITGVNDQPLEEPTDENNAHIGDVLDFTWVGTLPSNLSDYDTYYYVFTDTLSKGFTLLEDDTATTDVDEGISVFIDNNGTLTEVTDYFWIDKTTDNETDSTIITVGIQDLLTLNNENTKDDDDIENFDKVVEILYTSKVVVTYKARLNENAVVGVEGNPNKVKLVYSNNPNDDGEPDNDSQPKTPTAEPDKPDATGTTPESETWTYTTGIVLKKVDEQGKSLSGAEFQITSTDAKINVIVSYTETYAEAADGQTATHYALKDGTYTDQAPTNDSAVEADGGQYVVKPVGAEATEDDITIDGTTYAPYDADNDTGATRYNIVLSNADSYASDKIYVKNTTTTVTGDEATETEYKLTVGQDGYLRLTGLGAGTYSIKETVAPTGYNLLNETITVVIGWTAPETLGGECEWDYTWNCTKAGVITESETNANEISIINTSGSTLPETGGMGTTLFYVFGGIMVLAAVVLLVTKKRVAE